LKSVILIFVGIVMKKKVQVSVGLVTWNSASFLPECLSSLKAQCNVDFDLTVVDNASSDDSHKIINEYFPQVRIIQNSTNLGFCAAHNQAIRASHGEYYLPLNPDIVLTPGYLAAMVSAQQGSPDIGLSAGRLLLGCPGDKPRRIDSTGLFIDRKRRQYLRDHGESDTGQHAIMEEVFGVDGSTPLYRRSMLEDIAFEGEYFDESFFAHKEDVDLSWRARLFGWRCMYTPEAVAYHRRTFRPGKRTGISPATRLDAVKNRYLLLLKNELPQGWRRDWLPILMYDLRILIYLCIFERTSLIAFPRVYQLRKRTLAWRHFILSNLHCEPDELLTWFK
jgi:GT2 family glycosyltransferase